MTVGSLVAAIGVCLLLGAGLISGIADDPVLTRSANVIVAVYVVWWLWKGQNLKGWIGDSYQSMQSEYDRLNHLINERKYPNGGPIPNEDLDRMLARQNKLLEMMHTHPDNPHHRR